MRGILVVLATIAGLMPSASGDCSRSLPFDHVNVTSENTVFSLSNIQTAACEGSATRGWCPDVTDKHPVVEISFDKPSTINQLRFRSIAFDCSSGTSDVPHMTHFKLTYTDSLDPDKQDKAYPTILRALGSCHNDTYCQTDLKPDIFTDKITIHPTRSHNLPCFAIEAVGCQLSADDIVVNDVSFLSMSSGVLTTPLGQFEVRGEVELTNSSRRRFLFHPWGHFFGLGGWLAHFPHHHGHHHGFFNAFSHPYGHSTSINVVFNAGHSHNNPFLLHNAYNSSLLYNAHSLVYKASNGVLQWVIHCPWRPLVGLSHVIRTTFHHALGLSLHVNNNFLCSGNKPQHVTQHVTPGYGGSLCIGHCFLPSAPTNVALSNFHIVGAAQQVLSALGLQGLLGSGRTQPATTTVPVLTTKAAAFTAAPTTTKPPNPSATTPPKVAATTSMTHANGPVCYTCGLQATDGQCKSVSRCQAGEVCSVFKDPTGYNHKCLKKDVCQVSQGLVPGQCFKCCASYLCNERCSSGTATTAATTTAPTTKVPCFDSPTCNTLQVTGYNVCSDFKISHTICNNTCHTC